MCVKFQLEVLNTSAFFVTSLYWIRNAGMVAWIDASLEVVLKYFIHTVLQDVQKKNRKLIITYLILICLWWQKELFHDNRKKY